MTSPPEGTGALTPEQRELFQLLSKKKESEAARGPISRRADPTAPAPLSHSQHRLWFFDQLVPDSPAYNISLVFRLRGPLDRAALERSLVIAPDTIGSRAAYDQETAPEVPDVSFKRQHLPFSHPISRGIDLDHAIIIAQLRVVVR